MCVRRRAGGYVGLDNQGSQFTGRSRVLGGAYVNSLLGTGDQLRIDGAVGYEHGGLVNGRLDYSMLVSGYAPARGWHTAVWTTSMTLCRSASWVFRRLGSST